MIKWCQEACRKGLGTWGKCSSGKEEPEEKSGGRSLRGEGKTDHRVSTQKKFHLARLDCRATELQNKGHQATKSMRQEVTKKCIICELDVPFPHILAVLKKRDCTPSNVESIILTISGFMKSILS